VEVLEGLSIHALGKAEKDGATGWFLVKDNEGVVHAGSCYNVIEPVAMTDTPLVGDGRALRKMQVGDSFTLLEGPTKQPDGTTRAKVKMTGGSDIGWVTIQGNAGTVYASQSSMQYKILKDVALKKQAGESEVVRNLEKEELIDLIVEPCEEKVEPVVWANVRVLSDNTCGWVRLGTLGVYQSAASSASSAMPVLITPPAARPPVSPSVAAPPAPAQPEGPALPIAPASPVAPAPSMALPMYNIGPAPTAPPPAPPATPLAVAQPPALPSSALPPRLASAVPAASVAQIPAQPVSLALANSVPAAPQEGVGSIHAESVGAVKAQSAGSVNTESASAATAPVAAKGEAAGTAPAPASVAAKAESANTAAPVKKPKGAPTPKAARGPATPIAAMVRASGTSTEPLASEGANAATDGADAESQVDNNATRMSQAKSVEAPERHGSLKAGSRAEPLESPAEGCESAMGVATAEAAKTAEADHPTGKSAQEAGAASQDVGGDTQGMNETAAATGAVAETAEADQPMGKTAQEAGAASKGAGVDTQGMNEAAKDTGASAKTAEADQPTGKTAQEAGVASTDGEVDSKGTGDAAKDAGAGAKVAMADQNTEKAEPAKDTNEEAKVEEADKNMRKAAEKAGVVPKAAAADAKDGGDTAKAALSRDQRMTANELRRQEQSVMEQERQAMQDQVRILDRIETIKKASHGKVGSVSQPGKQ